MIERVSLFNSKKEILYFLTLTFSILIFSLLYEFYNYKQLTKFDSALINATVLKQYAKTKLTKKGNPRTYQVLKLKSDEGFVFYTTASKKLRDIKYQHIQIEAWAGEISFYEYMSTFFAFSKILKVDEKESLKNRFNMFIDSQHKDKSNSSIYQALFSAKPLSRELQGIFSNLGVSHLIAISGFHLGVLSGVLFFLLKYPYKFFQNRYFPYRSYKVDSFVLISGILLLYLLFLDSPPSLLRAFVMLVVGFILYDRGVKIVSMQTLFVSLVMILIFFPRLFLSVGFWLSISGVYYIFLFLIHYKHLSKLWQFTLIPIWVYLLMLPYSLVIFSNFSVYHPLSIIWTSLFTLFYPLSILLHLIGFGDVFDGILMAFIEIDTAAVKIDLSYGWLILEVLFSLLSLYKKEFIYLLLFYSFSLFIYAINYVT
ncbi:ComEC/Rec2 family competence protein [Sulfurimonas aquatica]|uniref:ComEC/Rec2 family competence protein n=1 Tax=Sulfurimonas aquatica TaxID=2672570 RepID=A0A975GBP3_9BACT|nr:ComEC/Rec2 family competence protein [Sulfurimonas aquatica]QSZ40896.1 ComEC/Rec2 family competence protein [Sulfurimonas aquatica]